VTSRVAFTTVNLPRMGHLPGGADFGRDLAELAPMAIRSGPHELALATRTERSIARLLILDDEDAVLLPLGRYFAELDYEVVTCREPEEAEALLECERFDLVILDLGLTRFGREGLEVLSSIRASHPWLPVIIFSAYLSPEVEEEAHRLKVDAVLGKPQPLEDIARVVETLLGCRQ
jgi:CheY-like chemotaxis protein